MDQILTVNNFHDLVTTPFHKEKNAICWSRKLLGDFKEIISKIEAFDNVVEIEEEELREFDLSDEGNLAREIILNDLKLLTSHGADPILNLIKHYERDGTLAFFPTDVYSFHVDRAPIMSDTFLCTYYGAPSEIISNSDAIQKIQIPEIINEIKSIYQGDDQEFENFLTENYFDLHYQAKLNAIPISLGIGNLWRLCSDYPDSNVLPCIHRAPIENRGESRLLLIC